jgi:hypothetical protein
VQKGLPGQHLQQTTIVREALAERMSGKSLLVRESFIVQAETMAAEIAGPGATVVERLLADQIATSHLHLTLIEKLNNANCQCDIRVVLAYQPMLTLAQKRYLAVNTLARVRNLAGSSLQINIGEPISPPKKEPTATPEPARCQIDPAPKKETSGTPAGEPPGWCSSLAPGVASRFRPQTARPSRPDSAAPGRPQFRAGNSRTQGADRGAPLKPHTLVFKRLLVATESRHPAGRRRWPAPPRARK